MADPGKGGGKGDQSMQKGSLRMSGEKTYPTFELLLREKRKGANSDKNLEEAFQTTSKKIWGAFRVTKMEFPQNEGNRREEGFSPT